MNKITISLFAVYFIASSLALPLAQDKKEEVAESPSKPMTHIHIVDENDAARRMYYERYIMQRDDSLQHSANTGGRVSVDLDVDEAEKVKRQALKEPQLAHAQVVAPAHPVVESPAPVETEERDTDFAKFIKNLGVPSRKVTGGASYGRKRRSAMEEEPERVHVQAVAPVHPLVEEAAPVETEERDTDFAKFIKNLGVPSRKVTGGASYGRKRRGAMEEDSEVFIEKAPVQPKEEDEPSASRDREVLRKIAMAYMLQSGKELKPRGRGFGGASYGG